MISNATRRLWLTTMRSVLTAVMVCAVGLGGAATTLAQDAEPVVRLETSMGNITLKLFPEKAPITVANFLSYVDSGHYNGTVFHRVISNFMIQGGGFDANLIEKPTKDPIINESVNKLHNIRGSIAMARTSDPDSAGAQFFINQRSNLRLDWAPGKPGYTVFGEVIDGMGVVDFISVSKTGRAIATTSEGQAPLSDVPAEPIILKRAVRVASP